jgi:uncharacterized alpha-E superfamily protein
MLSRIAESLFWIGRYVERAEDTARVLEVLDQLVIEDPHLDAPEACRTLLSIMGVDLPDVVDRASLMHLMIYDLDTPSSMVSSIAGAHDSARRARETISTEMWTAINTTWRAIPSGRVKSMREQATLGWARERAALITGTVDSTMSRDEGWHFWTLGKSLERVDMTARLLTATALFGRRSSSWRSALRACGAHDAFLRTYRGVEADDAAAEFLLQDRLFPRSLVAALTTAEQALEALEFSGQRAGFGDEAQRLLGRARANLEYRPISEILVRLPQEMEELQHTCSAAAEATAQRYFDTEATMVWTGGPR